MNLNVTQDNLYLFIPSKVSWVAEMISEEKNVSIVEAIKDVYLSDIYSKLENNAQ